MNILITGGAGFIGSHTAERLINKGHHVTIIDDYSTGNEINIPSIILLNYHDIFNVKIPVLYKGTREDLMIENLFETRKFDAVIHLAAQVNVRKSIDDPLSDSITNISGSIYIFELCKKYGVKKVVFSSSGGTIYGESNILPTPERYAKNIPSSPYGIAKLAVENYLNYYITNGIFNAVILRYGNVYGPRQTEKCEAGVIAIFLRSLFRGESPIIFGDGNKTRDYVYVDDVVDANELALDLEGDACNTFNIGTGRETSVNELFDKINNKFDNKFVAIHEKERAGELERSCLDISYSKNYLNWSPKTSLDDGIQKTYEWLKEKEFN